MDNKINLRELPAYQTIPEIQGKYLSRDCSYDLSLLPTEGLKKEMRDYLLYRSERVAISTLHTSRTEYCLMCRFLTATAQGIQSFREYSAEEWRRQLRMWMMREGIPLFELAKPTYRKPFHMKARLISYMDNVLEYFKPEDPRSEQEKDVWELEKLDIQIRNNPIKPTHTLNFTRIFQKDIRNELKKGIYLNLQFEAIDCIKKEIRAMQRLSAYLQERRPKIQSCQEIDREQLEDYLTYMKTEVTGSKQFHAELNRLRSALESIGKTCDYPNLTGLFLTRDIPPTPKSEFKTYSDAEMQRINAALVKMDEQVARLMIIHQMLGIRISDTLTLRPDCLYERNGETIIRIRQMKSTTYEKPISADLAALIRKAIAYTKERYGETPYIFVNEATPNSVMKYNTLRDRVTIFIKKENLRDDNGQLFGFGTHMYRHYYCVKLAEMHLDDWTLAKLLGHSGVRNVKYYRKMSNQVLADDTRRVREKLSRIILENLDGWEDEYAQVRQDGILKPEK